MHLHERAGRSALLRLSLGFVLTAALGASAGADELVVGSTNTLIQRGSPYTPVFNVVGACGGQVTSMASDNGTVYVGAVGGSIYRLDPGANFISFAFLAPNDATALAMHQGGLLVGGSDGTIVRMDPATGQVLDTLNTFVPVAAMAVSGDTLFVGSQFTVFHGSATAGNFQFFGICGGDIQSIAFDGTHLLLGAGFGSVYGLNVQSQSIDFSYSVSNDAQALALHLGDLLVGGSDGSIVRVERTNGAVKGVSNCLAPVSALLLEAENDPGTIYCYGISCPCGNDDSNGGCSNSSGFGARIVGAGTTSVGADDLRIAVFSLPQQKTTRLYMAQNVVHFPFGAGFLCAGAGGYSIFRFPIQNSGPFGAVELADVVAYAAQNFPATGQILPGTTWNFQAWFRDPNGPCSTFGTSNAYSATFVP